MTDEAAIKILENLREKYWDGKYPEALRIAISAIKNRRKEQPK